MVWTWEAIAGFVTAVAVLAAGGIAWQQLGAMKRASQAAVMADLFTKFRTDDAKKRIKKVYQLSDYQLRGIARWSSYIESGDIFDIEAPVDAVELIGIHVCRRTLDERIAVELFGG
jgi:hypothetical protein